MERIITALKPQKGNPNRVNVHLDGEFAFGLARIAAAWLKVGEGLDQERIDRLLEEDAEEKAYQRALRLLSYRPRSRSEIAGNLQKHDVPQAVIEAVLARLEDRELVDDVTFARVWVENRSEFRPRGSFALRAELRRKGVAEAVIEQALAGLDEVSLAFRAGRMKSAKLKETDEGAFKKKLYGHLARRGFNYEILSDVVNALWHETKRDRS